MLRDGDAPIPGSDKYKNNPALQKTYEHGFERSSRSIEPAINQLFRAANFPLTPAVQRALDTISQSYGDSSVKEEIKRQEEQAKKEKAALDSLSKGTTPAQRDAIRNMSLDIIKATGRIIEENNWETTAEDRNLADRVFTSRTIETAAKTGLIIGDRGQMGNFAFDFAGLPDLEDLSQEEPPIRDRNYYRRLDNFTLDFATELGFEDWATTASSGWSRGTRASLDLLSKDFASNIVYGSSLPSIYSNHPTKPFLAVASMNAFGEGFKIDIAHSQLQIYPIE